MKAAQRENIIWYINSAVIILYTVALVLTAEASAVILSGIVSAVLLLVLMCTAVFFEHKVRYVSLIAYAVISVGMVILCRKWWSGFIFLTATALFSCYDFILKKQKKNILINLLLVLVPAFLVIFLSSDHRDDFWLMMVLYAGIIIVVSFIWSLIQYYLNRYFEININLENALRSSALDAMNERRLRMEIAETKNLAEENARLEERERISRDIHNAVGHTLSAATVTLDAAQMLMDTDKDKANMKIDQANERIHEAIGSVRSVVRTLDSKDDSILVCDYISSLKELLNNFTLDTDIKIHHNLDIIKDNGKLKIGIAAFISSAISELLTNGVKHGGATVFVILITLDQAHIGVQVSDNGTGWGKISYEQKLKKLNDGFGLKKIESYVKTNGGSFEIEGEEGFCIKISLMR